MHKAILKLLNENARYSVRDLAIMSGLTEEEVQAQIAVMEAEGVICGYKAIIDWEKLDSAFVSALIELKVIPQPDAGFEEIASNIMKYKEVESVYLMSGSYDLCVIVKGKTFQDVCMFVAKQLAPMKNITSTATHFVLRRYKEMDVELCNTDCDDRGTMSL